jgi:phage terminase large subunit-like protein
MMALDRMPRPIGIKPKGSKTDRMAAQSFKIEAGQVHLPTDAPWLDSYLFDCSPSRKESMTTRSTARHNF